MSEIFLYVSSSLWVMPGKSIKVKSDALYLSTSSWIEVEVKTGSPSFLSNSAWRSDKVWEISSIDIFLDSLEPYFI